MMLFNIFPEINATNLQDIYDLAYKILMYPYDLHRHAFNPVGAPNTWPYVVAFLDWIAEFVIKITTKPSNDIIMEEEIEDERRNTSMDQNTYIKPEEEYKTLVSLPSLHQNSYFNKYIEKLQAHK